LAHVKLELDLFLAPFRARHRRRVDSLKPVAVTAEAASKETDHRIQEGTKDKDALPGKRSLCPSFPALVLAEELEKGRRIEEKAFQTVLEHGA
jgi:hypothetical protein